MKKIKKTVIFIVLFTALLFTVAVVINLPAFDEELLPEVKAINNIKAEPFTRNNALPAIIAFNASTDSSLAESAEQVRSFLNQKINQSGIDFLTDEETLKLIGNSQDRSWNDTYTRCSSRRDSSCFEALYAEISVKPVNSERLKLLLNRYRDLISMSDYSDFVKHDINAPFPAFGPVLSSKKIALAQVFIQQDSAAFLSYLDQDLKFWRMVLGKSHMMITKMVAIASVTGSINAYSAAIKLGRLDTSLLSPVEPLNNIEADFGGVFEYEFKYGVDLMETSFAEGEIGFSKSVNFYQKNATHNYSYQKVTQPLKELALMDAADFYQFISNRSDEPSSPLSWTPASLYNPVGKILVGYAVPAYEDYIARIHDLNGMIHLLNLQIELAKNPEASVQQVIQRSKWVNPYTLEPMSYDVGSKRIYFECMDKTSSCELNL